MTAIAPPLAPLPLTVGTPVTGAAAAAPTAPLGATALPVSGASQDAMLGALRQLVTVLNALVEALKGAAQANGGGPVTKGGGPEPKGGGATPVQSPVQAPTQTPLQGGGPTAPSSAPLPATSNAPAATLQPVPANYQGPYLNSDAFSASRGGYSTALNSGSADFIALGGHSAGLQFMGRYGTTPSNQVHLQSAQVPIGTKVQIPDAGSVTLSTGATFSWTSSVRSHEFGLTSADPTFTVSRGGGSTTFNGGTIDQVDGFGERVSSPLTSFEIAELANQFAARFPATPR
ncbi:MAG: hypothetical protein JWL76_1626 [Thermoleophilia bacterium]|nr:hypothetical protein [Thermoleophilia bacterium]